MDDFETLRIAISRALAAVHAALDDQDARGLKRAEELTGAALNRLERAERRAAREPSSVRELHELMQRLGLALGALGRAAA